VTVCCHLLLFEAARDLHQGMNLIYVGVDYGCPSSNVVICDVFCMLCLA